MTPQAIQIIGQIRHEFYTSFANSIWFPVHITSKGSYSNPPKISWTDSEKRQNYLYVYAHLAPDAVNPTQPLILRLGVNKGLEPIGKGKAHSQANQQVLRFQVTLLPDEILSFVPWLVNLFQAYGKGAEAEMVKDTPCSLNIETLDELLLNGAWTQKATLCVKN